MKQSKKSKEPPVVDKSVKFPCLRGGRKSILEPPLTKPGSDRILSRQGREPLMVPESRL